MNDEAPQLDSAEKRSDSHLRSKPLAFLQPDKQKKPWMSIALLGGGIVILLVAIGVVGSYAGWWAGKKTMVDGEQQKPLFGQLPFGGDAQVNNSTSGLSGMPCDHPNRRAIGVMLAGDPINRPMSGFSQADMVFELPVLTNGVTRLTGVYQCGEPKEVGSVRSVRHDYLFLVEGIDGIMGHWGGSYHALNRIAAGEFQTINALQNPFNTYFRKNNLPAPYNGFTNYENLWNALQKLGYRTETKFKGYEFKDDAPASERPAGGTLSIAWPGAFRVSYEYDPATNRYVRSWAGVKQVDAADGKVVAPSVVAIMRATNQLAVGEGGYNDVGIEGGGALEVYQDGKVIKGTWKKNELEKKDPVHFLDETGKEITFTRGQVWIMAVEPDKTVTWEVKTGAGVSPAVPVQ
jgi:hypothetical protein